MEEMGTYLFSSLRPENPPSRSTGMAGFVVSKSMLKCVEGYVRKATQPCAFAYASARIRRLVRLGGGFYCLAVAE